MEPPTMTGFERRSLWISTLAVVITGLGFTWAKYFAASDDPWSVVNHPLEPWFLKAHVLVAPLFLFAVGLVTTRHIVPHLRNGVTASRRTGLIMVWTILPMVATGYLLQVISVPEWLRPLAIAHIATGLIFLAGFLLHRVRKTNGHSSVE
jgi:hypothetical protein